MKRLISNRGPSSMGKSLPAGRGSHITQAFKFFIKYLLSTRQGNYSGRIERSCKNIFRSTDKSQSKAGLSANNEEGQEARSVPRAATEPGAAVLCRPWRAGRYRYAERSGLPIGQAPGTPDGEAGVGVGAGAEENSLVGNRAGVRPCRFPASFVGRR